MKALVIEASCFMSVDDMDIHINKDNLEKVCNLSKKGYYTILACGRPKDSSSNYLDAFKYAKAVFDMKACKVTGEVVERTSNNNIFSYPNIGILDLAFMQASREGMNCMSDITFIGCEPVHEKTAYNAGCNYKDIGDLEA